MDAVHIGPLAGVLAQAALLVALAGTVGLSSTGWVVGVSCGIVANALVGRGIASFGVSRLGPADWVTLTRLVLVGGVAAVSAGTSSQYGSVTALVMLSVVALVLDAVDGQVARRSGSASAFGARFDMEVDAFLILVLSVYVARSAGAWVLAIGAARYALLAAAWVLPWLHPAVPPRYWRKVVAAVQGIVLTIAAADVLPQGLTTALLVAALALLAESFGRDVVWLWSRRGVEPQTVRLSSAVRAG